MAESRKQSKPKTNVLVMCAWCTRTIARAGRTPTWRTQDYTPMLCPVKTRPCDLLELDITTNHSRPNIDPGTHAYLQEGPELLSASDVAESKLDGRGNSNPGLVDRIIFSAQNTQRIAEESESALENKYGRFSVTKLGKNMISKRFGESDAERQARLKAGLETQRHPADMSPVQNLKLDNHNAVVQWSEPTWLMYLNLAKVKDKIINMEAL